MVDKGEVRQIVHNIRSACKPFEKYDCKIDIKSSLILYLFATANSNNI